MATPQDLEIPTAAGDGPPSLVLFREGQPLLARDLDAEQAHLIALRRLHNAGLHGWGVASGLRLLDDEPGLRIEPGFARDGYGRELVVAAPIPLPGARLDAMGSDNVDVALVYVREAQAPGDVACAGTPPRGRWREDVLIRLVATMMDMPTPQAPSPDPSFAPPDDPRFEAPVYLGRLMRTDAGWRRYPGIVPPYASLLGEQVLHPSGSRRARLQVGAEAAGDRRRFVVSFRESADGPWGDRLAIDRNGNITLRGHATIETPRAESGARRPGLGMELSAAGGPRAAGRGGPRASFAAIAFTPLPEVPKAARPWQIYRATVAEGDDPADEIRVELADPGDQGDPANHRLVVLGDPAPQPAETAIEEAVAGIVKALRVKDEGERAEAVAAVLGGFFTGPDEKTDFADARDLAKERLLGIDPAKEREAREQVRGALGAAWSQVIVPSRTHEVGPILRVLAGDTVEVGVPIVVTGQRIDGPIPADPDDERFKTEVARQWARGLAAAASVLSPSGLTVACAPAPSGRSYTITVTNVSEVAVGSIQVSEQVVDPPGTTVTGDSLAEVFALPSGQPRSFVRRPGGTGDIRVSLMVVGVAVTGNLVFQAPDPFPLHFGT